LPAIKRAFFRLYCVKPLYGKSMATSSSPKSIAASRTLQVVKAAGGGGITLPAANLMIDTFETANMTPTLNDVGFSWAGNNRTSIVTMDPDPVAVWNNGLISTYSPDLTTDWTAYEGDHCLRFRFASNPNADEVLAEQRWSIAPTPDLWVRYWLRVPVNFLHPVGSTATATNCKFLSIWKDTYDVQGTVTWQIRQDGDGSRLVYQDGGGSTGDTGSTPFISVPADRGRWMQCVARVKTASSDTAQDGIIQFWRRWGGDSAFTQIHEKLNADTWEAGAASQGFQESYILGSHRGYIDTTEFFVDTFELSDQPLVPAGTAGLI
jgi:hypothetical protein